jgi:hypothetical protein
MDKTQNIIYDLLYGESDKLTFDMTGMAEYIEEYTELMDGIVSIAKKGAVTVIEDSIIVDSDGTVFWELKIKRK